MKKHLIAAAALALAVAAGGAGAGAVSAQGTVPELRFGVTPKAVTLAPGTQVATGPTKIVLDRTGKGESGLALVRLDPGVTVDELRKALPDVKSPADAERYGRLVASTFLMGKARYTTTIRLEDADYAWVDVTRRPAVRLAFHAGPAANGAAEPREVDATVQLRDYAFTMPSRLKAGRNVLRTTNAGDVQHHALVFPLAKGVDARRLMRKIRAGKEPTREFAGPPSALVEIVSPDTTNDVELTLRRGKYLFVCFLQDTPKAKMHAQLGMQKVVTVR